MRTDKLHLVLLVIAIAGICFGLYGMFLREPGAGAGRAVALENSTSSPSELDQEPSRTPQDRTTPANPDPEQAPPGDKPVPKGPDLVPATQPADRKPDLRGDGVIEGLVLSADGNPVPNANVGAIAEAPQLRHVVSTRRDEVIDDLARSRMAEADRNTWRTVTDAEGKFRFSELARGQLYTVSTSHEHWGRQRERNVAPGEKVVLQFVVVALTSGMAVDPGGKPVPGLQVMFNIEGKQFHPSDEATTSSDGKFVMRWEERVERFRLQAPGFVASEVFGRDSRGRTDLRVIMRAAPRLVGVVETPAGTPVAKADIKVTRARDLSGETIELGETGSATADLAGRFVLDSLPPGSYTLRAVLGSQVSPELEVKLEGDTQVKLVVDSGGVLVVRVLTAAGKPLPDTYISIRDRGGDYVDSTSFANGEPGETCYSGLPRAIVEVQVRASGMAAQWLEVDLATGPQRLEVVMKPGCVARGRVVDSAGRGLSGLFLKLIPPGGGEKGHWLMAYSEDNGAYETAPLHAGTWLVEVYMDIQGRRLASANIVAGDSDITQDFNVPGICLLRVRVESTESVSDQWITLYCIAGDETEPGERHIRADGSQPLAFPEGTYRFSASNGTLASRVVEATLVAGRDNEVTLTLAKPNALRFRWVDPGTDLSRAGVKTADILIEYDGRPVHDKAELNRLIEANRDKTSVPIVVLRGGARVELSIQSAPFLVWLEPAVR